MTAKKAAAKPKKTTTKSKGKDLMSFRALHDKSYIVPLAIRSGLVQLGDSWEYEQEFVTRCRLSLKDFGQYREQFAEYYVEIGGKSIRRVWAGTKAYAQKLKEAYDGTAR